jgi:hypothetical protein
MDRARVGGDAGGRAGGRGCPPPLQRRKRQGTSRRSSQEEQIIEIAALSVSAFVLAGTQPGRWGGCHLRYGTLADVPRYLQSTGGTQISMDSLDSRYSILAPMSIHVALVLSDGRG